MMPRDLFRRLVAVCAWLSVARGTAIVLLTLVATASGVRAQEMPGDEARLLRRAQETVLAASPLLAAAQAELEAARARAQGAGLAPPMLLSAEIEDVPNGYELTRGGMRLEVGREFLTGGRSTSARALAAAEVRLAEARREALERGLRADVLRELTRMITAEAIGRRVAAEDTLLLGAEASLRDRFSVGEARYVDVLRLRAERLRVQTDRSAVIADGQAAREALLGFVEPQRREEIAALADSLSAPSTEIPVELPAAPSVESLLELAGPAVRASALVERAQAAHAVALAEQRVRIAGSLGAQRWLQYDGSSGFGPILGVSVTLPFTANRANRAARRAAEQDVAAAELSRDAVLARVRGALAGAAARYEAARERLAVYDAALLRAARQERESALAAYRSGELTLLELLDFERSLARAEIDRLRAYADAVDAYANLISAAAGEASGDLE